MQIGMSRLMFLVQEYYELQYEYLEEYFFLLFCARCPSSLSPSMPKKKKTFKNHHHYPFHHPHLSSIVVIHLAQSFSQSVQAAAVRVFVFFFSSYIRSTYLTEKSRNAPLSRCVVQITTEDPEARLELLSTPSKVEHQPWARSLFKEIGEGADATYFMYVLVK